MDLTYRGFEVAFPTKSVAWTNVLRAADAEEDRRVFEIMPAPANAALHRYIKDLAHEQMELAALRGGGEDAEVITPGMCVGRGRRWRRVG